MASEEVKNLVKYLKELGICNNPFLSGTLEKNFQDFLTDVRVPVGFTDDYKLEPHHTTYKFRHKLVKTFIDKKKYEDFRLTDNSHSNQFFDELKQFAELSETEGSFSDFDLEQTGRLQKIDLFEENVKVKGVVVCKFSKKAKVCVLIKRKDLCRGQTGSFSLSEVFVDLREEDDTGHEGFHLKLAVGDIVEVTKCRRKEGTALEPEIVKCYSLSDTQIEVFLRHLSNFAQDSGSSATRIEITRFSAAWEYILNLSKEKYTDKMIVQIFEIINKISTVVPMSPTVSAIVQEFQQSILFGSVIPGYINKVTGKTSHLSMVQQILEHVITAVPASGLQVLPMATDLAHNLVKGSGSSEREAKESGHSAIAFLSKMCSIIASEVPGAQKDVDKLPWKELSLIPVTEEIFRPSLKTSDLPVIREKGNYESEEDYLNTYFRLLREECFYKLRKGISEFVEYGQASSSKDLTMYRVSLRGCSTRHENSPTVMLITLEYELPDSQEGRESENVEWLMHGSLLCISLDGFFEEPVWAVVEKHFADERIVGITLCEKGNTMSEPQFIAKMQELRNKKIRAFMAESQTFYVSYAPAMEILQHRDHVPFKEFLVYPDSRQQVDPPDYIGKIKHPPNWGIIYKKEALAKFSREDVSLSNYSLIKDFADLRLNISSSEAKPDETQLAAIAMALEHRVILIQGPPGTGKSFVGVTLVQLLLSMNVPQDHGPILVVTYKNHALDNFLKECLRQVSSPDLKIVRVGRWSEEAGDELKKCLLRERVYQDVNRKPVLYNQKRKVLGQIWALQPKVREAFEKLRTSSRFSADMFLKEASEEQLKSLVVGSKQGKITDEELEKLISKQSISKNQAKLKELVENALIDWLPSQKLFDRFSGEKKKAAQGNRPAESDQQKRKEETDQQENPNDARDPSVEQRERLLALDEEIADEEDQSIAKEEESSSKSQAPLSVQCLRSLVCLDDAELRPYEDILNESKIWELEEHRRVQFVYVLQSKYFSKASSEFKNVSRAYLQLHHQLKEVRNQQDIEVMKRCHVIGMTVTGATMRANILADIKPSVVIVEEAAEILEGQLVAVIPPSVQHLIMIGDHKQLKPMVHYHRLKKHHHLDLSMFERLWNCRLPCKQLGFQCRMRDEFVDVLRELKIYDNLQTHKQLVENNVRPACVESSMYFWTHTKWESEASHSKRNSREAEEITRVAKFFCQEGKVPPSKITVLCSYRGQVKEIESHFRSTEITALEDIKVTTIDSFQGQENDIILVSLVRSSKEGGIGYLASMDRLCVAISRARCGLYLFGNHVHLSQKFKKGWKIVSDFMRKRKQLGSRFPFRSSVDSESLKPAQSSFVGESPGRGNVITVNSQQAFINVGGANSANTINAPSSGYPSLIASSPPQSGIRLPSQIPGKTPVQDPRSPLPVVTSPFDTGTPRSASQDARSPTQATSGGKKSLDGEDEKLKEGPVQESANPPKDSTDESLKHLAGEQVFEEKPVQEIEDVTKDEKIEQPKFGPEDSLQEGVEEFDKEKPLQETEQTGKNQTVGEQSLQHFEEFEKEKPVQEAKEPGKYDTGGDQSLKSLEDTEKQKPFKESPGNETEGLSESKPLQETANSAVKTKSTVEEEVRPTQETVSPIKGLTEESDQDKSKSLQETGKRSQRQDAEGENTEEIQTGNDVSSVDNPDLKRPKQETARSEANLDSLKEEPVPTQETMAAGKGPFEESGLEVGVKVQPTDDVHDNLPPAGNPESIQPKQETASSEANSDSLKEEPVPTQETMAAGKGPFEESGLEVGFKVQPTDDVHDNLPPAGNPESIQPKQETASSDKESDSLNEELVPTQETMAAGKGPFEESGLEVGVKAHPTDEVHDNLPPAENPESIQPEQETATSEVETENLKEEVVPTQETMAAGKGPFEESGLEVGVKAHPTDEKE